MPFLNFLIELSAQTDGSYAITVQSSPVGEASVVVENPFTPNDLQNALEIFGRRRQGITRLEETQAARQLGERLFNFLIRHNEDINAAYFASLDRAGANGLRLNLSLGKAGPLAELPWELMRDPNRDFLALSSLTPITRYTQQLNIRPPVPVTMPLRVLVLISAPVDFPRLDVEGEWQRLQTATAELQKRGLIALERLSDPATLIALQRRLRAEDYHIFHFIGHSDFDAKNQQGVLVFETEQDQKAHLITGDALAREVGGESTIRLVVLNSCQSARRTAQDPFSGIASGIVQLGIPAVVAMQFPITDGAASVFAEEFYNAISESLPIDRAVGEARRAIANRIQNSEWATPVLFMRSDSGILFRSAETPAEAIEKATNQRPWLPALAVVILLAIILGGAALFGGRGAPQPPPSPTAAGKANLEVVSVRSSPARPAPGEAFRLLIAIRNSGIVDSGPFNWTWDASPTLLNALGGRIANIAPGATQNISFPYSYGWWGSYSSQIIVDADSEVAETDERDNRDVPIIQLNPALPLDLDFTLLPSNEIVTPPRPLAATEFSAWNLAFSAVSSGGSNCIGTPFQIIGLTDGNALAFGAETAPTCAQAPVAVIIRRPVSNVIIEVSAQAAGQAVLAYFSDEAGARQIFQTAPVTLRADGTALIGASDGTARSIRRIEISAPGQAVRLSRLTLFPISE